MVSPARKREAVAHVCQRLEASERRACRALGQARSSQRYKPKPKADDARLTAAIRRIAAQEPRAGYRGVHRRLIRDGWNVNRKRVHRIWRKEGLRVRWYPDRSQVRADFSYGARSGGGGVFGVLFSLVPPLEESCPRGSAVRMGPKDARRSRGFLWATFRSWFSSGQAAQTSPEFGR